MYNYMYLLINVCVFEVGACARMYT